MTTPRLQGAIETIRQVIAAIGPAIGLLAMAFDQFKVDAAIMFLAANGIALLLAAIPLVVHNWQQQNAQDREPPAP